MNEELQVVVTSILEKSLKVAEASGEFLVEQTPEVLQQLLLWHGVESGIWFTVNLATLLVIVFYLIPKSVKGCKDKDGNWEEWCPMLMFWSIPIVITLLSVDIVWLKILIAPKLYLLEYATSILK